MGRGHPVVTESPLQLLLLVGDHVVGDDPGQGGALYGGWQGAADGRL